MVSSRKKQAGDEFDDALHVWFRARGDARREAERTLRRLYRRAWEDRREAVRIGVLLFLARTRPEGGKALVLAGLRSARTSIRVGALSAAGFYVRSGWSLEKPARVAIERIAERDPDKGVRNFALHVLIQAKDPATDASLERISQQDGSPGMRVEADLELLRRGHKHALRALFDEHRGWRDALTSFPEARAIFDRVDMPLTRREEQRLDRLAAKAVDDHRARLGDTSEDEDERALSAVFLARYSSKRFPIRAVEVDTIGKLALNATTTKTGAIAVNALAVLGSPRAKRWLQAVTETSHSREVVRRAKRSLTRLQGGSGTPKAGQARGRAARPRARSQSARTRQRGITRTAP